MARHKERIERLEAAASDRSWQGHEPGWLSVRLDFRPVLLRLFGFDLEPLNPAPELPIPCNVLDPALKPIHVARHAEHKRTEQLREKLKCLGDRSAAERLAAKHGYRIIYAPAEMKLRESGDA